MNDELREACDLLIENRQIFRKVFKYDYDQMLVSASLIYTNNGLLADEERLRYCLNYLKKNEGIFSDLRGNIEIALVGMMAMASNCEQYLEDIKYLTDQFNKGRKFFTNSYSSIAAMILHDNAAPEEYDQYLEKSWKIFQQMKDDHGFLTSDDDIVLAVLLAVSDINVNNLLLDMDECYELLKGRFAFVSKQELSHVLALDFRSPGEKVERLQTICDMLKERKIRYGSGSEMNMLALLNRLDMDDYDIVNQLEDVEAYLKPVKGFHGLSMDRSERLCCGVMLIYGLNKPEDEMMQGLQLYMAMQKIIAAQAAAAAAA